VNRSETIADTASYPVDSTNVTMGTELPDLGAAFAAIEAGRRADEIRPFQRGDMCPRHGHADPIDGQCERCWADDRPELVCRCGAIVGHVEHAAGCQGVPLASAWPGPRCGHQCAHGITCTLTDGHDGAHEHEAADGAADHVWSAGDCVGEPAALDQHVLLTLAAERARWACEDAADWQQQADDAPLFAHVDAAAALAHLAAARRLLDSAALITAQVTR